MATVHVESWRASYAELLSQRAILSRTVETRTRQWTEWLVRPAGRTIMVVEHGGRVVGFAAAGPSRDPDAGAMVAELYSLYLAPGSLGQGLGRMLWNALPDQLAAGGYREASLWVAVANRKARQFYIRCGFRSDGGEKLDTIEDTELAEIRYRAGLPDLPFVAGLARSLDDEDFDGAARRLDPALCYETGQGDLVGIAPVIDSYRRAAQGAHAMLDELVNESAVLALGGDRYRVDYTDRLRHHGYAHVFRCQQILTLPPGRGVTRIVHRELRGERTRLLAFFRRAGVRARS
ncbi:MAG: GNAT family N-acetyltransferase [Oligoflexia bacterium]|nr:GNAT family N-acetyltransferase [Oligoflexia bacterium]